MRTTLESALDELREKRSIAEAKLAEMKQKGGEAWDQAKTEIDEAVRKLESSYEALEERLQES